MKSKVQIALVGDYNPKVVAHAAIPKAIALAANGHTDLLATAWIPTLQLQRDPSTKLDRFSAIWCVPGSPYADMDGALAAIRFARENKIPFLGTCGGFQHTLIEFARNVLGIRDADHAESNPATTFALVTPLACPLHERKAVVHFNPGSRIRSIYKADEATERFNCGYGLNPQYRNTFSTGALRITGTATDRTGQAVELDEHPFFIAVLFQPERSALDNLSHPLINAFVQAALDR